LPKTKRMNGGRMGQANIIISAEDRASAVINHVESQLGIFSKQGIATGIAFAVVTQGIQFAEQAIGGLIDYISKGVEMNRAFELSLARLSVSTNNFDVSMGGLKDTIKNFSVMFATDLTTLTSGLQNFIREGFSASDSIKLLFETEKLATVTGEDLNTTQEAVSVALDAFGLNADSAAYVVDKFNQITSETGLSVSQLTQLIGRSATAINDGAITLDTFVNVLYTLYNEGYRSRGMIVALNTTLKNLDPSTLQLITNTTDLNTKFKTITSTTQFTIDQLQELYKLSQMNLTGGMDLSAVFDKDTINTAKGFFDTLQSKGITSLQAFNNEIKNNTSAYNIWSDIPIAENRIMLQLVRTFYAYNDAINTSNVDELSGSVDRLNTEYNTLQKTLTNTTNAIQTNKTNISDWKNQMTELTTIHNLNSDLRYMQMGLIDASYAVNIQNSATRDLVNSIRTQQQAIDDLNASNKIYNMESNANTLQEMQIQYTAYGQRHGLTRGQQRMIDDLEHANMGLRINTMENQQQIDQAQLNLDPLQKRLELTKMWYDEEIYTVQNTYGKEINALQVKIDAEQILLDANYVFVQTINKEILQNELDTYNARKAIWQGNPTLAMNKGIPVPINPAPHANEGPLGFVGNILQGILPSRQFGGGIPETGPYLLHRGETVVPANQTANSTVNITNHIYATINNDMDVRTLAQKLASAQSKGLIDSSGKTRARMR